VLFRSGETADQDIRSGRAEIGVSLGKETGEEVAAEALGVVSLADVVEILTDQRRAIWWNVGRRPRLFQVGACLRVGAEAVIQHAKFQARPRQGRVKEQQPFKCGDRRLEILLLGGDAGVVQRQIDICRVTQHL